MPLTSAFAVQHNTTVLAGLTQLDTQFGAEVRSDVGNGSLFPQFAVVTGVRPRLQFSSRAIDAVLAVTGTTGAAIATGATLKAYYAQLANGVPASGTVHTIYTFDRGLLVPRRLQCSHRQDATIDCEAVTYSSDGTTKPLIESTGALPTIVRDNIRHTLKSATVGELDLGCFTDISVDFGVQADTLGCKSDTYDKHLTMDNGITPVITITTLDTAVAIALEGMIGEHADTEIVLRQYDESGILFATGEDENDITISAHGVITRDSHSGSGNQRSQLTVRITCAWDGTNAPIVLS
jgi:hypothetical protein